MKRKRDSEEQIISILKQHEAGRTMDDLAREHGIAGLSSISRAAMSASEGLAG